MRADIDRVTTVARATGALLAGLFTQPRAGKFERAEVPAAFQSLSFGFINYQPTQTPGFTVWIDDVKIYKVR